MDATTSRWFYILLQIVIGLAIFGGLYAYTLSRDNEQQKQTAGISTNAQQIHSQKGDIKNVAENTKDLVTRGICSIIPNSPPGLDLATCLAYFRGDQGIAGVPGQNGIGTPGPIGLRGAAGADGTDGLDGVGAVGAAGASGAAGTNGIDGANGTDGTNGIDGVGVDGTNGTNGADGSQGLPGKDGADGAEPASFTFTYLTQTFTCTDPEGDGSYACS